MNLQKLQTTIKDIDIYILDQILKNRYQTGEKILDAGCGSGRNLKWFYTSNFEIHGIDISAEDIEYCKEIYSTQKKNFNVSSIEEIKYKSNSFNHIICNAVLHFAKDLNHFNKMLNELLRVLKSQGILFIRMASNFGIEDKVQHLENGVYELPDGTTRFLLTQHILDNLISNLNITFVEDVKTTIVHNKRCMTTLVVKLE
ncbi:MAG: class I SAM-dependent methyltransferase [Lutibacter sp.]|uniref:class I SAM-dependent methyltransferase n=1 Tax=Lutibacter sp. TaxID=1925666 RepID=UPI0017D1FEFB|nr:class I SAM-dependent methyltransferase [Lutibacter sp.]MBT8317846.1 class I SAM-dependent methyltransferase [Lutibacter sp.]NNJ58704.1 class I SAM-dependent methyltransferase [Lutibacter sp.]